MRVITALFGPVDAIEQAQALADAGASGVFTFEGPTTSSRRWCWPRRSAAWTS